jgi:hypothetical protein
LIHRQRCASTCRARFGCRIDAGRRPEQLRSQCVVAMTQLDELEAETGQVSFARGQIRSSAERSVADGVSPNSFWYSMAKRPPWGIQ